MKKYKHVSMQMEFRLTGNKVLQNLNNRKQHENFLNYIPLKKNKDPKYQPYS